MPSLRFHLEFDEHLAEQGVIEPGRNTRTVHRFMDKGASRWGPDHRDLDPNHNPGAIRDWIASQVERLKNIRQDTATDYVRVALGHWVLDHVVSAEKDAIQATTGKRPADGQLDHGKLIRKAWRMYTRLGFDRCYHRGGNRGLFEKIGDGLFGRGDRARA